MMPYEIWITISEEVKHRNGLFSPAKNWPFSPGSDDMQGGLNGRPGIFADTDVVTTIDGRKTVVPAGGKIILHPGQSVTLTPGQYHQWQGVPGSGDVILFEVSATNDDNVDNRFYRSGQRIPDIEEDEAPKYLIRRSPDG